MPTIASVRTEPLTSPASTDAEFTMRYYGHDRNPVQRRHGIDDPFAVDITNYLAICANDDVHVRALALGSWQFDLDGECAGDKMSADIRVVWSRMLSVDSASGMQEPQ